jgi:hypothetical protein
MYNGFGVEVTDNKAVHTQTIHPWKRNFKIKPQTIVPNQTNSKIESEHCQHSLSHSDTHEDIHNHPSIK